MELRQLKYFLAVAEDLHFRRAAERLHVAQPAISEQIRKLEAELGVQLFHRTQRHVSLTPAGVALQEDARRVLEGVDAAVRAAQRRRAPQTTTVHVGYVGDALPPALPLALARLRKAAPLVDVDLRTGGTHRLLRDLRAEHLDVAIVGLPAPAAGLRLQEIAREPAVAVVAATAAADELPITLAEVAERPVLVLPRAANPAFHSAIVGGFRAAGLAPRLLETARAGVEHLLLQVAAGGGTGLVPASVADRMTLPGAAFRPILDGPPSTAVAAATRDEQPRTAVAALLHELARAAGSGTTERPAPMTAAGTG
jgi:DNA-binding transcriptional LysR family regulator